MRVSVSNWQVTAGVMQVGVEYLI